MVSVICPVYNEENYIKGCINSILLQDYPLDDIEVIFVDGGSSDKTKQIITEYSGRHRFIKVVDNLSKIAPAALNKGIEISKGSLIIRIDGHCIYPRNYLSTLIRKLEELEADNVGTLLNTVPANETVVCYAIAIGMSHGFGVGNSYFRIGVKEITEVDTVPFGCFKREVFNRLGLFDIELIRNQDDEFNARIIDSGGKIFLLPEIKIDYFARETISKMSLMFYQYALFKPLVNKKRGKPATIRQFVPVFFLIGLIIGAVLCILLPLFQKLYFSVLSCYLLVSLVFSVIETVKYKKPLLFILLPYIFFVIHISYGFGYLKGYWKVFFKKKITV